MLDVTWTVAPSPLPRATGEYVMILVDRTTAHPRLLVPFRNSSARVLLLWIVTPSAIMNWSALLSDPLEARTSTMMAALGDRMEAARRRLTPLQRAATAEGIDLHVRIAHGALVETAARIAREEQVQRLLIPQTWGEVGGVPQGNLLDNLSQRLRCSVESFD